MKKIDFHRILSDNKSKRAFIFFHGWKGNKSSFINLPNIINLENTDWYFPEAPYIAEDKSNEKSWAYQSSPGIYEIKETERLLDLFINDNILKSYNLNDVYIMGFSQGAAVCYELFLNNNYHWGGVFPVGGFLRNPNREIRLTKKQLSTPVVIGHGLKDEIIPIVSSENIYNLLVCKNANVEFIKYKGSHKISMDYLKQIKKVILNEQR